jgi:hypothetical protein
MAPCFQPQVAIGCDSLSASKEVFLTSVCYLSSLQVEDPLSESVQYLQLLQQHAAEALETHLLAFELYIRKKKLLLALQVS